MKRTSKDLFDDYNFRLHRCPPSCFKNPVYFFIKRTVLGNFAQPSVSWGYAKEDIRYRWVF